MIQLMILLAMLLSIFLEYDLIANIIRPFFDVVLEGIFGFLLDLPMVIQVPMVYLVCYILFFILLLDFRLLDWVIHGGKIEEAVHPLTYDVIFKRSVVGGFMFFLLYLYGLFFG